MRLFGLALILIFACNAGAQQIEYGDASELRDRRAWLVHSDDLELRKEALALLQAEVKGRKLPVEFVDSADNATLVIVYTQWWAGAPGNSALIGELVAIAPVRETRAPPLRLRIIYSTRSQSFWSGGWTLQRPPLVKATRRFLDEWAARNPSDVKR